MIKRIFNGFIDWILSFIRSVDSDKRGQVLEMAINTNFDTAYEHLLKLEFSSDKNALHWNTGEKDITFMGIYRFANPKWGGWVKMDKWINCYNLYHIKDDNLKKQVLQELSVKFYADDDLKESVKSFYKANFWDTANLDNILVYDISKLIFCFGVNVGVKKAIKYAQQVVGVENDGIIGKNTINALNGFNPLKFEVEYKQLFITYYTQLAKANPAKYERFLSGWLNRVKNT